MSFRAIAGIQCLFSLFFSFSVIPEIFYQGSILFLAVLEEWKYFGFCIEYRMTERLMSFPRKRESSVYFLCFYRSEKKFRSFFLLFVWRRSTSWIPSQAGNDKRSKCHSRFRGNPLSSSLFLKPLNWNSNISWFWIYLNMCISLIKYTF